MQWNGKIGKEEHVSCGGKLKVERYSTHIEYRKMKHFLTIVIEGACNRCKKKGKFTKSKEITYDKI